MWERVWLWVGAHVRVCEDRDTASGRAGSGVIGSGRVWDPSVPVAGTAWAMCVEKGGACQAQSYPWVGREWITESKPLRGCKKRGPKSSSAPLGDLGEDFTTFGTSKTSVRVGVWFPAGR